MGITAEEIKALAVDCGFELAGITPALPLSDYSRFDSWRSAGFAGEMAYLTDHRGDLRNDPRHLLPEAQSILCVGKLYNTGVPGTEPDPTQGWISRYAWSDADYHTVLRSGLNELSERIATVHGQPFASRVCVDTAPLLERSYAQAAGLGWIGKNTCLINQAQGSWFFLGELLLSIPLLADGPPPHRCGTCRRCIDACPTDAIVPDTHGSWCIDSNLCISYLTIEKRGDRPLSPNTTNHIFGCDICQDICPWNRKAPTTDDDRFAATPQSRQLDALSELTREDFAALFRNSPVWRSKYEGFLRNVAIAMGNSQSERMTEPLKRLMFHPSVLVANAAALAFSKFNSSDSAAFETY